MAGAAAASLRSPSFFLPFAIEPTAVIVILLLGPRRAATAIESVVHSVEEASWGDHTSVTVCDDCGGTITSASNASTVRPDAASGVRASVTRFDSVA